MSEQVETKKERSVEEIRNDYTRVCAQVGHIQYQIATLQEDLKLLTSTLRELNFEANTKSKKEGEKNNA